MDTDDFVLDCAEIEGYGYDLEVSGTELLLTVRAAWGGLFKFR